MVSYFIFNNLYKVSLLHYQSKKTTAWKQLLHTLTWRDLASKHWWIQGFHCCYHYFSLQNLSYSVVLSVTSVFLSYDYWNVINIIVVSLSATVMLWQTYQSILTADEDTVPEYFLYCGDPQYLLWLRCSTSLYTCYMFWLCIYNLVDHSLWNDNLDINFITIFTAFFEFVIYYYLVWM